MFYKKHILIILFFSILFLSCTKQEGGQREEIFDTHSTWTNNDSNDFWDKQQGGGFQIDTAGNSDTIIYF